MTRTFRRLVATYVAALFATGVVSYFLYRVAGQNYYTLAVSFLMLGAIGYWALRAERLSLADVGGSLANVGRAAVVLGLTYGLFYLLLLVLGTGGPLASKVSVMGFVDNWLLTGGCEELLFRGFMLVALIRLLGDARAPWRSVLASAALFSLFHLPFALYAHKTGMNLVMDLLIPFASSLIVFGPLYLLSRNLWLVALVHGVTDYPVLPQIKENPLVGLVFMVIALLLGRFLLRSPQPLPLSLPGLRARKAA